MRDNRTMLRFRLQGGMGLTKGVLIDLICDGVTSSDVDWRISEVLRVWGETQKDAVTVNIQDNLTRYVSRITCSRAWIEIVMVSDDLLSKQTYTIAARCLKADLNNVEIENGQDSENEESDAIRIDDLVIMDNNEKFIDRYFGEGTS
ncbi:MAG: hypothetical protein KF824_02250 [Fimbriimonadaceae bacterium]|nr:MAG: hypothetical protein KF824_02250 [Fimbriimonadaceae bacterium]